MLTAASAILGSVSTWHHFVSSQLEQIRKLQFRIDKKDIENEELKERLDRLERRLERSERRGGQMPESCTKELTILTKTLVTPPKRKEKPIIATPNPSARKRVFSDQEVSPTPAANDRILRRRLTSGAETTFAVVVVKPEEPKPGSPSPPKKRSTRLVVQSEELRVSRLDDVPPVHTKKEVAVSFDVPGFREQLVPVLSKTPKRIRKGSIEDEDLSDAAFCRRHLKHERHERQIVLRDKRRQRDILQYEMGRERLDSKNGGVRQSCPSPNTTVDYEQVRSLDDLTGIHIVSKLPKGLFIIDS